MFRKLTGLMSAFVTTLLLQRGGSKVDEILIPNIAVRKVLVQPVGPTENNA